MPFNGSGTFAVYTPGTPYVNLTTIDETVVNAVQTDFATGLTNCVTRDGQSPATANLPMGGFRHTGVGNASTRAATPYASAADVQDGTLTGLTTVAGTNTVTATAAISMTAYATNQVFAFVPANTNTGATTANLNSIGAKNVFWNGVACVGGELRQNIPAKILYDGTQFHIIANGFNAPFNDAHAVVSGSADPTKKIRIEADGLTTATTRVITMPDLDVSLGNGPNIPVKVFTATGTDTVPAWAHRAKVYVKGSGGGGGSSTTTKGGGGGEGEERWGWFSVTPGATVTVTLNNGGTGAGSNANASGAAGGTSVATDGTFTVTANGGSGGTSGNSGGAGGPGGTGGSGGDYGMSGNAGQAGSDSGGATVAIFAAGGGKGGAAFAGNGVANTGGGGGGGGPANAAGNGAKGTVVVEYWP